MIVGRVSASVTATLEALELSAHTLAMALASNVEQMRRQAGPNGHIHWATFQMHIQPATFNDEPDWLSVTASAQATIDEGDPLEALALALSGNRPRRPAHSCPACDPTLGMPTGLDLVDCPRPYRPKENTP